MSGNGINDSPVDGSYEPENPASDDTIVHEDDSEYDNAYRNLFIGEFLMGFCITNGFYFRIMVISTTGIVLLYMLLLYLYFRSFIFF